jgi:hypothetical protein
VSPDVFWSSIRKKYPVISSTAVNNILEFTTSYVCEQAFSCLMGRRKISCAVCGGRTASEFVKTSIKNSTSVQKETGPSFILKVSFILTLKVKFILMLKRTLF